MKTFFHKTEIMTLTTLTTEQLLRLASLATVPVAFWLSTSLDSGIMLLMLMPMSGVAKAKKDSEQQAPAPMQISEGSGGNSTNPTGGKG